MSQAREVLSGKWGIAIIAFVIYEVAVMLLSFASNGAFNFLLGKTISASLLSTLVLYFVSGPLVLGVTFFYLSISRNNPVKISDLLIGFNRIIVAASTYLLMVLFIMLWAILLIIPGIIAALSYSQAFFILADNNSISAMDALKKSKEMMNGNKWKFFCLGLRFIGWMLLCIPTLGIGFLWLFPYMSVSYAKFYDDVKNGNTNQDVVAPAVETPVAQEQSAETVVAPVV